jgi:hypothetical protein
MPTVVMPEEKAQDATLSLRQLIWQFRQHLPSDGETGEVEAVAILTSVLADVIESGWKQTLERVRQGQDAEKIRTAGAALSLAGIAWQETFQAIQEMAEKVRRKTGEPIKWLPVLADEAKKVEEIRASARRLIDSVNTVFDDSLDQEMLKQSDEDFAAGRVKKDEGVISRLRSPKPS